MNETKLAVCVIVLSLGACASVKPGKDSSFIGEIQRREALRHASVWSRTDIPSIDFKKGPPVEHPMDFNEWVDCDYKQKAMKGKSPKFSCETNAGKEVKVKYGHQNAEVYGEVLATRLFWALGFPADVMFPVRVRCHGCSPDPQHAPMATSGIQEFDPADIEQKLSGRLMESHADSGWSISELDEVAPEAAPDERIHRDALKLLMTFIQHADHKAANQRLLCPEGEDAEKGGCKAPLLMVQDLGLTFGESTLIHKNQSAVDLRRWAAVPVWSDARACKALLGGSITGRFTHPKISEEGRAFLAGLLDQLSDAQIRDLFETARVELRVPGQASAKSEATATIDDWVAAFKRKRAQISQARCPA